VELDKESVEYLGEHFPELDGKIISADFLKLDLQEVFGKDDFCVIGNYPYNISSQILFKVLDYKDQIPCCSGMFQREVAQRVAAPPGSKTYGILSVLLQAWYDIEYLFTVPEHVFNPPPKVKSGVIKLTRNGVTDLGCDEKLFKTVVKTSFGQRRKTLRNSLRSMVGGNTDVLNQAIFAMRPEQLSVAQFIELTNIIEENRVQSK
jgi:16S rRNA (adenine1518-N6/adenine1519-N6)-dimethyltransferase